MVIPPMYTIAILQGISSSCRFQRIVTDVGDKLWPVFANTGNAGVVYTKEHFVAGVTDTKDNFVAGAADAPRKNLSLV